MLSSFTPASAYVVNASAQPDYLPAGIDVHEADPLVAIGGLWEFRSGELFGGAFGVGYAGMRSPRQRI